MKKIGVTGGIGSGKTVVCDIFKILGVKVYYADLHAKEILNIHPDVKKSIMDAFGSEIYQTGEVDRKLLAARVFNNTAMLDKLNSIVHPAVFADFDNWLATNRNEAYIIKEAAVMFESGSHKQLDAVVLVYSPLETRIQRVIERDKTSREDVLARIKNQMDDTEKLKLSNYVIYNNHEQSLIRQVLELHNIFKEN